MVSASAHDAVPAKPQDHDAGQCGKKYGQPIHAQGQHLQAKLPLDETDEFFLAFLGPGSLNAEGFDGLDGRRVLDEVRGHGAALSMVARDRRLAAG